MTSFSARLRPTLVRPGVPSAAVVTVAGLAALAIAWDAGVKEVGVIPEIVRGGVALLALLVAAGYAPTRLLAPRAMLVHLPLLVPLVGAVTAGLALTVLGFVGAPLPVALGIVLVAGLAAGVLARVRLGPARPSPADLAAAGGRPLALAAPACVALVLAATLLTPVLRDQVVGVPGMNPDAMLGAGTVELLREAGPLSVRPELPVDRMPWVWNSKYPIYYVLAAAAELSGLSAIAIWAAAGSVLAGLTALGFFLLARYAFGAGPFAALIAMGFVAADRVLAHLALHPYHNQLWGTLTLAPMLLFGLRFIDAPNRRDGALCALFLALGLAAYPLMVLFPAVAFVAAWLLARRERRGLALLRPRLPRRRRGLWIAGGVLALPAVMVLLLGVLQKMVSAAGLLVGGDRLWRGDLTSFRQEWFFGPEGVVGVLGAVAVLVLGVLGLRRAPRATAVALGATVAVALLATAYFRVRVFGEYFHFKVVAFLFPLLLVAAACWLSERAGPGGGSAVRRVAAAGAAVLLMGGMLAGLRDEVRHTGLQADRATFELRDAAARILPAGASVRLDVAGGRQLWAGYVLADHPITSTAPIVNTTYPYPPEGRRADFIVAERSLVPIGPWPDAAGAPLFENEIFRLYRMREGVPGPDVASQEFR
jgi:hypothetical protein